MVSVVLDSGGAMAHNRKYPPKTFGYVQLALPVSFEDIGFLDNGGGKGMDKVREPSAWNPTFDPNQTPSLNMISSQELISSYKKITDFAAWQAVMFVVTKGRRREPTFVITGSSYLTALLKAGYDRLPPEAERTTEERLLAETYEKMAGALQLTSNNGVADGDEEDEDDE